jgi:phosphoribosylamine--glycine ligase
LEHAIDGTLDQATSDWDPRAALGVVLAAGGYPMDYAKGKVINGIPNEADANAKVFQAGTKQQGDDVVTAGGRVLCAVGLGENVTEAQKAAYELTKKISWDNVYYRDDIGYRAVARESNS